MDQSVRILLLEEDSRARRRLAAGLRAQGYEVTEAADGVAGLVLVRDRAPHVAIIHVRLPRGPDGLCVARRLRAHGEMGLILLGSDSTASRMAGFDAGADDYVVEPFDLDELLARIRAVVRRLGIARGPTVVGDLVVDENAHRVTWRGEPVMVSRTELALLSLLARQRGRVLSKPQLLASIWGGGYHDPNLVEAHVARLRRKLREAAGEDPIRTVRGRGYAMHDAFQASTRAGTPPS